MLRNFKRYQFEFMTKKEHDKYNTFDQSIKNRVVLNIASKFHKSWVGYYGCSINISSKKSYSGIIAYSPALILDNIEDNAEKICFLINGECSIDYIVSVFFSIYLIEFRRLPKYYREILDYIEAVENDTLEINNTNIINLFTLIKSLSHLKSLDNIKDEYEKKMYILKKGLKVIEYILMRLEELNNYTKTNIFDGSLIEKKSKFEEEIRLIEDDYDKYLSDTSEEVGIVLKDKFKVYSGEDNNKIYVDTLIFLKCSNSIFYRQWANNDKTSPSKKGYKFIIGIERKYNGKRSEERKGMEKIYKSEIILNRYVISVDLNMGLKLYDLAMYLEMFEQIKEKEIFSNDEQLIYKWRDKKSVDSDIFQNYEWCINKYPWYDGQLHKFSIVNSSTVDSILSINEVIYIAKNFTEEYIDEMDLNYLYSFNYKYGNHKKINQILEMNSIVEKFDLEIDKQYFLNIIEEYFNNNTSDSIESYKVNVSNYTIFENKIIDELKLNYKMNFEFECKIYMFSYGIGFIRIRIKSKKMKITDIFTENIALLNKTLYNNFDLLKQLFKDNAIDIFKDITKTEGIRLSGCNIFHIIKVYNENITKYNKAEIADKIINEYYNEMLFTVPKNLIYRRDDVIGFSKKGMINIMFSNNLEIKSQKKYINIQEENNWKRNFPIFLFALNQRKAMLRFSEMLSIYDKRQKTNKISQLRLALLKFVTQSWFSQITEDEFGMEIYNNWCEVFESEKLLNELDSQITTLDDYNKNRITNIIETVSIIGFPILALSTIFGMNILETKGITIKLENVLLLSTSLFVVGFGLLKRFKLF